MKTEDKCGHSGSPSSSLTGISASLESISLAGAEPASSGEHICDNDAIVRQRLSRGERLGEQVGWRCKELLEAAKSRGEAGISACAAAMLDGAFGDMISSIGSSKVIAMKMYNRGILMDYCEHCWVEQSHCYCTTIPSFDLQQRRITSTSTCSQPTDVIEQDQEPQIKLWLFQHSGDWWRVNNSGKLMWLVFGMESAPVCLCGVEEHEERLKMRMRKNPDGFCMLWPCPVKGSKHMNVSEICTRAIRTARSTRNGDQKSEDGECIESSTLAGRSSSRSPTLEFILLDGTWSTAKMMSKRVQRLAQSAGVDSIPTIHLTSTGVSELAKLRPQPDEKKTCTAAAAIALLRELDGTEIFKKSCLNAAADALMCSLDSMTRALICRRESFGLPGRRDQLHKVIARSAQCT